MSDLRGDDKYWVKITFRENKFLRCDFPNFALSIRQKKDCAWAVVNDSGDCLMEYAQFFMGLNHRQCKVSYKELAPHQLHEAQMIFKHYQRHGVIEEPRFLRFFCQTFPELITV